VTRGITATIEKPQMIRLRKVRSRSASVALATTSAPLVEKGLESTMDDESASAVIRPIAPTGLGSLQERHGQRDERTQDAGGRGERGDDAADVADEQRGEQRQAQLRDVLAEPPGTSWSCMRPT
jgi:hypothetical protein